MKEKKNDGKGRIRRRFCEAVDGPMIRKWYGRMPTAELAQLMGLTVKQIENYVYRHNLEDWARKDAETLSRINSEKGKKGGRPRKKGSSDISSDIVTVKSRKPLFFVYL